MKKKGLVVGLFVIAAALGTAVLFRKRILPFVFCKMPKNLPQVLSPKIWTYSGAGCPKDKCWGHQPASFNPEEYRVRGCKNIKGPVYKDRWIISSPEVHILCQPVLTDSKSPDRNYDRIKSFVGVDLWGWNSKMHPVDKIQKLYDEIRENEGVWNNRCGTQQCTRSPDKFLIEISDDIVRVGNNCQLGIQNLYKTR